MDRKRETYFLKLDPLPGTRSAINRQTVSRRTGSIFSCLVAIKPCLSCLSVQVRLWFLFSGTKTDTLKKEYERRKEVRGIEFKWKSDRQKLNAASLALAWEMIFFLSDFLWPPTERKSLLFSSTFHSPRVNRSLAVIWYRTLTHRTLSLPSLLRYSFYALFKISFLFVF